MKRLSSGEDSWKLGRRATLGITDQVLSSLTNFALNILVVRSVSTAAYGTFALAYVLYILFRGAIQALVAQPLLVRHTEHLSGAPTRSRESHRIYELALGGSVEIGLVGGGMLVVGALFVSSELQASLLVLAILLPGLMLQEIMRAVYFAQGRPGAAIAVDSAWAVAQLGLVGGLLATGNSAVPWLLFAWGVSGGVSALLAMAYERLRSRLRGATSWLLGLRDLSLPFFGEIMVLRMSTQGIAFVLAAVAGIEAVGIFRSAQVLFSPLNVLLQAVPIMGIPEGVRLLKRRPDLFATFMVGGGAAVTLSFGLWCGVVLALPASIGQRVLGASWPQASQILPQSALFYLGAAASLGALIGLRALAAARTSFAIRTTAGVVGFVLGTIGAARTGASGAALGLGAGAVLNAVVLWIGFARRAGEAKSTRLANGDGLIEGRSSSPAA